MVDNIQDRIVAEAKQQLIKIRKNNEMWLAMTDPDKNYFNSGDESNFFIRQGECKRIPETVSSTLETAMGASNPLLREASDEEIQAQLETNIKEYYISRGLMKPDPIKEQRLVI